MNRDTNLIWESYALISELAVSEANAQRLMRKYNISESEAYDVIGRFNRVEGALRKDIFTYSNYSELNAAISQVVRNREKITKGADKVFENDKAEVFYIKTKEASIKLGRRTKWCISYDDSGPSDEDEDEDEDEGAGNLFNAYTGAWVFDDNLDGDPQAIYNALDYGELTTAAIYFVLDKSNAVNKFAVVVGKSGYKEIRDRNNILVRGIESILSAYDIPEAVFTYANAYTEEEIENRVLELDNSSLAYAVSSDLLGGKRWLRGEPLIMRSPLTAAQYAAYVIKGEWSEAEPSILKHSDAAYFYAIRVLKRRWPEGERIIMGNPELAFKYARDVIKNRWPEAERSIMSDPTYGNAYKGWFAQKDREALYKRNLEEK